MYRLNYHYFKRNPKDRITCVGQPIYNYVESETLKGLNKAFNNVRENHDVFMYHVIMFDSVEEV